jgi:hypothetical protein
LGDADDEAKPLKEHRYYKRVTSRWTTRCWGLAILAPLLLPAARLAPAQGGAPTTTIEPAAGAPGPAASENPSDRPSSAGDFVTAWSEPVLSVGTPTLAFTPTSLILAGSETPTQARSSDDGRVLWTATGRADHVVVDAGLVVTSGQGQLAAFDADTGAVTWRADLAGPTPGLASGHGWLLVTSGSELRAYRMADGGLIWTQDLGAAPALTPALGATETVVALEDGTLAGFDLVSGASLWRERAPITPLSMLASGDRLYVGAAEGHACAFKLDHGRMDWCFTVRVQPAGPPVADDRHVYFAFLDNMIHVFDRRSGRRYYTPSLDALPAGGPVMTPTHIVTPVVTGEFVLLDLGNQLTITRLSAPRTADEPLPSTRAAAVSADGQRLAMVIASPTGRTLLSFRRKVVETVIAP